MFLRTEADMLRALRPGTYTVGDLYRRAEQNGLAERNGGRDRIQDGKERYKRRVRSALQSLKRQGLATRVGDGDQAAWLIDGELVDGEPEPVRGALFVWLPGDPTQIELVLGSASRVLAQCDEPIDLIVADPPWALDRDGDDPSSYARDGSQVVSGYVDVDPAEYADFTTEWMAAAAAALRPGGYLAAITGPQQAARVQVTGEELGLTYVNSVAIKRQFGVYCTRRFVHGHNRVTLLTNGPLHSKRRVFTRPAEMPRGPKGQVYAVDVWDDIPDERRPGRLRYNNSLHVKGISRIVRSTTNVDDLVADPFLGGGTTALACWNDGRRFYGGDINPGSLLFAMSRIYREVLPTWAVPPPEPEVIDFEWDFLNA
jgi:DNA modification methylase